MSFLNVESAVIESFRAAFGGQPTVLIIAPGRINIIGEHTDYNHGYVLPAAIDRHLVFAFAASAGDQYNIVACDTNERISITRSDLNRSAHSWANFLIGNLIELNSIGFTAPGLNCAFGSSIPVGAGLSSSSALECGFLFGIKVLFDQPWNNTEMINLSQRANHNFIGLQGGIMDQFTCLHGKKDCAILLDCLDQSFSYHHARLENYSWIIINSGVQHELIHSAYNDRVAACLRVVRAIQQQQYHVTSLRDVSRALLDEFENEIDPVDWIKASFVLKENERVLACAAALDQNDFQTIGELLYQSHEGLQHEYDVSCPEIDYLVDLTRSMPFVFGARMMGGGFGGCTINLVHLEHVDHVLDEIKTAYKRQTNIQAVTHLVTLADGLAVK